MLRKANKSCDYQLRTILSLLSVLTYGKPSWLSERAPGTGTTLVNHISLPSECPESCPRIPHHVLGCSMCFRRNTVLSGVSRRDKVSLLAEKRHFIESTRSKSRTTIGLSQDLRKALANSPYCEVNYYLTQIDSSSSQATRREVKVK